MKTSLRIIAFGLSFIFYLSLIACCGTHVPPEKVVSLLCSSEIGLPAGRLYYSSAPFGSEEYLPKALLNSYGIPHDYEGIESAALYLSGNGHPCEFAVFVCKDGRNTEDVSLFLGERVRSLSRNAIFSAEFCSLSLEEYEQYISGASVSVSGRYVALIVSSDPGAAQRIFAKNT